MMRPALYSAWKIGAYREKDILRGDHFCWSNSYKDIDMDHWSTAVIDRKCPDL